MDTLVKPRRPIPANATRIHGITNEMVAAAPDFSLVYLEMIALLRAVSCCVIYNADFDLRMIQQSIPGGVAFFGLPHDFMQCAMLQYARWYGDWSDYRSDFRWQKLTGGDHTALGDCRATLAVLQKMAGVTP